MLPEKHFVTRVGWLRAGGSRPLRSSATNYAFPDDRRPEGQDAQSEDPEVAIQYEELLGETAEWRLGNDDAKEYDKKQNRQPSEGCQKGLPSFQIGIVFQG